MTRTSSISGTFVKRQRSPVSVAAASILRAAFLAPLMPTSPCSGRPPSIRKTSRVTASGTYSQWNGLASAMVSRNHEGPPSTAYRHPPTEAPGRAGEAMGPRFLSPPTRTLAMAAFRDPDPEQRLLERCPGDRQVGGLVVAGLDRPLGLAARLLGPLEIDLRGHVGCFGHDDDLV